jgi:uncharacterized membrane protein (UPF0127 family)
LVRDGEVLASLDIADRHRDRLRGLLGRDGIDGALLIRGTRSVHTFGMRFDLDVAFLDKDQRVVKVVELRRHRIAAPVWSARSVVEAEAGSFREWGLKRGDELEVR